MSWNQWMIAASLATGLTLGAVPQAYSHGGECKADIEKFCKSAAPGTGELGQCIRENISKFSPECQAKMERAKQRHLACKADREQFCKDVQPGQGRIRACMHDHENELSPQCRAVL